MLITHGEGGRSGVGRTRNVVAPTSLAGQFEQPYGPMGPPTLFTIPVLRYMKTYGLTHEQLAMVSVVQREWAARNPRATFKAPITVEDVLNSRMIAYPSCRWHRRLDAEHHFVISAVWALRANLSSFCCSMTSDRRGTESVL